MTEQQLRIGSTRGRITPILKLTYGEGDMVDSLATHLAGRIDEWEERDRAYYGDNQFEDMIRNVCWDWMTGGSTAESVAKKIAAALGQEQKP